MEEVFGDKQLKPGQYLWRKGSFAGEPRVVVGLSRPARLSLSRRELVAVAAISTGADKHPTPDRDLLGAAEEADAPQHQI